MIGTKASAVRVRRILLTAALSGASLLLATSLPLRADPGERVSALADQKRVNVTIYNGSMALVHDVRRISLTDGENQFSRIFPNRAP